VNLQVFDSCPPQLTSPAFTASLVDNVVRVVDYDGHRSVTNAAEDVVDKILARWADVRADRIGGPIPIIYRDSSGRWDQLLHDGRQFTGFRALNAPTEEEAVRLVRRLHLRSTP
jgi:hypothetical protein